MSNYSSDSQASLFGRLPVISNIRRLRRKLGEIRQERDQARRERDEAQSELGLLRAERVMDKPVVVFYGAGHRAQLLLELYRINKGMIYIIDKNPSRWGRHIGDHKICKPSHVELDLGSTVIITEEPEGFSYENHFFNLQKLGIARDRCITIFEPGRIHQLLCQVSELQKNELFGLAYHAIFHDTFERAQFGYGIMLAAEAARRAGLSRVSIIELGVWAGAGLRNICEICDFITKTQEMQFAIYGFDTGKGLPAPRDYRDHPELWSAGSMQMPDQKALAASLPANARLILGDISETIPRFLEETLSEDAPLGFVSLDVDLYSSSLSAMELFRAGVSKLLPVITVWVDDSYVNVMQNEFCGEALAIQEYNDVSKQRKIVKKIIRTDHPPRLWHHCFYFAHIFDHPLRNGERPGSYDAFFHTAY